MKKIVLTLFLIMSLILSSCAVNEGEASAGKKNRIIATSVATCEILDKLEIDGVVGIPESQSYVVPERYSKATSLGSPMSPDMEIVKSLNPTVILSPNSLEGELKPKYDAISVDSYFLNLKSVDGMYDSIKDLGEMFGKQDRAEELCSEFEKFKKDWKEKNKGKDSPKVLILMGLPGSYVVATESSYVGNLVKLAGGENVYSDGDGQDFLNINTEDMLQKNPDIILRTSHAMPEAVKEMFASEFETNDIWKHFRAVQDGKVYDLDNNLFGMSATFRYPDALAELQPIFYGK